MPPEIIVSHSGIVCLVGGAKVGTAEISSISSLTDCFVGVDGGADHLLAAGLTPAAIIGDLDSLSRHSRATFARLLHHIPEQETTDFEKALTRVAAPTIVALGFTGGRLDHVLAVLNVLARHADRAVVLADDQDASFLARTGDTQISVPAGTRLALMPLARVRVTATGLRWPLQEMVLHPAGRISSSNEAAGDAVLVQTDGPLLVTLPRAHLRSALQAAARAG